MVVPVSRAVPSDCWSNKSKAICVPGPREYDIENEYTNAKEYLDELED